MKAILKKDFIENIANGIIMPVFSLLYIGLCCLLAFGGFGQVDVEALNYSSLAICGTLLMGSLLPSMFLGSGFSDSRYGWVKFFLSAGGTRKDILKGKLVYVFLFVFPIAILFLIPLMLSFVWLSDAVSSFPTWTILLAWFTGLFFCLGSSLLGLALPLNLSPNNANLLYILNTFIISVLIAVSYVGLFDLQLFSNLPLVPIITSIVTLVLSICYFIPIFFFAFHTYMKKDF